MTRTPRERIVYATVQSIRERGVSGTSLRDVVERAEAPRGSLQHYFPGGKDQLVGEALAWSGHYAAAAVARAEQAATRPSDLLAAMAAQWSEEFRARGFTRGCPLVAAAADVVAGGHESNAAVRSAFTTWITPLRDALRRLGIPAARARSLAVVSISSLEGAIVLSRAEEDLAPLRAVVRELGPVLDAAVAR